MKRKPTHQADPAFRAEIAEIERQHHEAHLARQADPAWHGDGLAILDRDPATGELYVPPKRVTPSFHAWRNGTARYQGSVMAPRR